MSNAAQLSTGCDPQVGAIRRASVAVKDAVEHTRAINGRLEAIKARVMGIDAAVREADDAPEPARNDLEELEFQISRLHADLNLIGNHLDDVNAI